jgi:hypothetical protein
LNNTHGIGNSATVTNANKLVAQAIPRFVYIWRVNRGNTPPKVYLNNPFAATALAPLRAW